MTALGLELSMVKILRLLVLTKGWPMLIHTYIVVRRTSSRTEGGWGLSEERKVESPSRSVLLTFALDGRDLNTRKGKRNHNEYTPFA